MITSGFKKEFGNIMGYVRKTMYDHDTKALLNNLSNLQNLLKKTFMFSSVVVIVSHTNRSVVNVVIPESVKNKIVASVSKGSGVVIDKMWLVIDAYTIKTSSNDELLAVILHEIGHLKDTERMTSDIIDNTINKGHNNIDYRNEYFADSYATKLGYGSQLLNFLSRQPDVDFGLRAGNVVDVMQHR